MKIRYYTQICNPDAEEVEDFLNLFESRLIHYTITALPDRDGCYVLVVVQAWEETPNELP